MTNTPDQSPSTDARAILARALDQVGSLVTTTDPAHAHRPTPCSEYDVAALIGHLQAVVRRIGVVVRGEHFDSVPVEMETTDWTGDWAAGRVATDAALAAADLDRIVQVPWGEVPIASALETYIGETATHAWDLAVATDRTDHLDDAIAEAGLPMARRTIPAEIRGMAEIPFGPVVEVADDAPAYHRLVAWNGRDPQWSPAVAGRSGAADS